ncbi:MAG: adenylate/guanylate cyclase domain-containing protein [Pseudomonadota bacterium]
MVTLSSSLVLAARQGWLGQAPEDFELWAVDQRFMRRGELPASDAVVLLLFDEATRTRRPALFEQRAEWALLLDALAEAGPAVVGIDALLLDPERPLPEELVAEIESVLEDPASDLKSAPVLLLQRVAEETRGDARLAAAIRRAGRVVLATHVGLEQGPGTESSELQRGRYGQQVLGSRPPLTGRSVQSSLPEFVQGALSLGYVTLEEDGDKTVRGLRLARRAQGAVYMPMAVALVASYLGLEQGRLAYLGPDHSVHLGERRVALDDEDRLLLNFRGPARAYTQYSAVDLLDGTLPAGALHGRIVLLGYSFVGHDTIRTPFGNVEPAMSVHAAAVDNILAGDGLTRLPWWIEALLGGLTGLLVVLSFGMRGRWTPLPQILVGAALVLAYAAVTQELFRAVGLWAGASAVLANAVLAMGGGLVSLYLAEGRQKRQLRRTFSHYLSDQVISQLVADPARLRLGGERRDLTVLFSDVRNFTSLSERLQPEALVQFLNRYLTPMTRAVLAERGFLDKYIGDAIMAVFGAPLPDPQHADRALACAAQFHRLLPELRATLPVEGLHLEIGVGINTGPMVVGNMGSVERFDYTVVGDAVNVASRLESLSKTYGVFCVVGEDSRVAASERFRFRSLDLVRVKGRDTPVAIHELLADTEHELKTYLELATFEAGVAAYREGEFGFARARLREFSAANPDDKVALLYLERLATLPEHATSVWDPATTLRHK